MTEKKDERGFFQRLIDAMKEMENPTRSKTANVPTKSGRTYSYTYETLDDILGTVRPALAKNGLMLTQCQKDVEGRQVLETYVFDATGEKMLMDSRPIPSCNDAQAQGSWETYLRRYSIRTAFGLTGEDDDGEATVKNFGGGSFVKDAKVTEMASDKQMNMIHAKLSELADLRRVSKDEAEAALIASKTMNGASLDNLTKQQASDAITLLINWVEKADTYGTLYYDGDQES